MKRLSNIIIGLCEKLDNSGKFKKADHYEDMMIRFSRDYADSPEFTKILDSIGTQEADEDLQLYNAVHGEEPPGYDSPVDINDPFQTRESIHNLMLERGAYKLEYEMLLAAPTLTKDEKKKRDQLWTRMEEIDVELQNLHDTIEANRFN